MAENKSLKQIIAEEYMKCAVNPVYFMKKYCIIQHPTKGKVFFQLYNFQENTLQELADNRYNVILKSRQMGISTLVAGYSLWCMLFKNDFNVLVIATTQEVAKNLVTKVRVMHENLPTWLRGITIEDNKLSLKFKNGSQIKAVSSAGHSGRSEALSLLIIDEAAFITKIDEIWAAAQQTLATGGGAIVLSTPNGTGNFFHRTWVDAESGGQFHPIRLHWSLHPERDESWRQLQTELLGERLAAQECVSGNSLVNIVNNITGDEEEITINELYERLAEENKNTKYSVLTPNGYQFFTGIRRVQKSDRLRILLEGGIDLECSKNHRFIIEGSEVYADTLHVGDAIESTHGKLCILEIETITEPIDLFDLVDVANGNVYFTNGLLSHNCDTDFISSGHTVVAGELIEWYRETYTQEPIEKRGMGGELWLWEYPDYTKDYIVAADVARGDGGDYSAFHIIELKSLRQVAEFRGKIGTTEYGHMLVSMATEYNNAILAIENANIGWAVIQVAIDKGYPNLYYSYRQDGYLDENIHLSKGYDLKDKSAMVPGFTTSSKTRPLMIAKLETYFREKAPIIHSKRLIDELLVFIWIGNRAEAQHGYNDDLIMSLCIALWIRDTALKLKQQGLDLTLKAVTHIGKHSGIYTVNDPSNSPWTSKLPDGSSESLKWLL